MTHNLDIQAYSFQELLTLFNLPTTGEITINDLKRAKMIVLKTHPDKSKLDAKYFLFYKKAFEVLYEIYQQKVKVEQTIDSTTIIYKPLNDDSKITKQVKTHLSKVDQEQFQKYFHSEFEQVANKSKPTSNKNDWFHNELDVYESPKVNNMSDMKQAMETFRKTQQQAQSQTQMTKYSGVQSLNSTSSGSNFYDDVDDMYTNEYITPHDIFGKLKFDDLRKVHKDQTILQISERDFNNARRSFNDYKSSRSIPIQPLLNVSEEELNREQRRQHELLTKAFESKKQTIRFEEQNKNILAQFLRLT